MGMSTGVFHPRFTTFAKDTVKSSFLGTVLIERDGPRAVWDTELGEYIGGGMIPLFRGRARVQKNARPTRRENVQDSADSQAVRVQIMPEDNEIEFPEGFEWYDNDRVTITANLSNTLTQGTVLYISGWAGSTNEWVTTLACRYNAKQAKL